MNLRRARLMDVSSDGSPLRAGKLVLPTTNLPFSNLSMFWGNLWLAPGRRRGHLNTQTGIGYNRPPAIDGGSLPDQIIISEESTPRLRMAPTEQPPRKLSGKWTGMISHSEKWSGSSRRRCKLSSDPRATMKLSGQ